MTLSFVIIVTARFPVAGSTAQLAGAPAVTFSVANGDVPP